MVPEGAEQLKNYICCALRFDVFYGVGNKIPMLTKAQTEFIQSLGQKKLRDQRGVFVAEGPKVVDELLHAPNIQVRDVFATADWLVHNSHLVKASGGAFTEIESRMLKRISLLSTPNQVVAICGKPRFDPEPDFEGRISLLLDGIQDPGNLGTIIRCADWFNVGHIICSPTCADAFSPKVVQSTMGSLGRVQVLYDDLLSFVDAHSDIPVYVTALDGLSLYEQQPISGGLLVIGNESQGVGAALLDRAKARITIPKSGGAESLNAAVATGIFLSHLCVRS